MRAEPGGATVSTDGQWWWDGVRWLPTFTPDGKWRFDGHVWRRTSTWRRPPLGVLVASAIWAAAVALWAPIVETIFREPAGDVAPGSVEVSDVVVVGVIIATAILGLVLGLTTQLRWTWLAALLGTFAQMVGYVAMMLGAPQPGGIEDDAAAVGVLTFALPTLQVVAGLLWVGAGTGFLLRGARRRKKAAPPVGESNHAGLRG